MRPLPAGQSQRPETPDGDPVGAAVASSCGPERHDEALPPTWLDVECGTVADCSGRRRPCIAKDTTQWPAVVDDVQGHVR
jgi:hypothetical protein